MKIVSRKKRIVCAAIGIVCVAVLAFAAFLSFGRAGGEIGFHAEVISVDGNWVTAKVTKDSASLFSKKLPDEIIFDATFSGVLDLEPGDCIHADYLSGTIEGNHVKVVSIGKQASS